MRLARHPVPCFYRVGQTGHHRWTCCLGSVWSRWHGCDYGMFIHQMVLRRGTCTGYRTTLGDSRGSRGLCWNGSLGINWCHTRHWSCSNWWKQCCSRTSFSGVLCKSKAVFSNVRNVCWRCARSSNRHTRISSVYGNSCHFICRSGCRCCQCCCIPSWRWDAGCGHNLWSFSSCGSHSHPWGQDWCDTGCEFWSHWGRKGSGGLLDQCWRLGCHYVWQHSSICVKRNPICLSYRMHTQRSSCRYLNGRNNLFLSCSRR